MSAPSTTPRASGRRATSLPRNACPGCTPATAEPRPEHSATGRSRFRLPGSTANSPRARRPAMPETPTFGRFAETPYDQMSPEQQAAYRFAVETRGPLGGPNKIWVHNPQLAKVAAPFGGHFQPGQYSLSEREREIAVIIINSKWRSAYPTAAHERRGKEVGLPATKVEAGRPD